MNSESGFSFAMASQPFWVSWSALLNAWNQKIEPNKQITIDLKGRKLLMFFGREWMGRRHSQLYNTVQC